MSKYTRLGKNTVLVFIGNAGSKLITLIMLPFYTRWLSVEDYGITDIINVYVTLLLGLATTCIAEAVFVFPKGQPPEKQKVYFTSGLIFAFISLLITALMFKLVVFVFTYKSLSNSFTNNSWIIYGLLVATFLQKYVQQFTRSIDKMKIYSTTGIVLTVCTALFSFVMIPHWGVFGYVFAFTLAHVLAAIYALLFSGAFRYFSIKAFEKGSCMEMVKYSIPLIPNSVMWWLIGAFNRPLMEHYLGMHAVGIFGIANKFAGLLSVIFFMFSISWQNSVMEEFSKEGYNHFYNKMFRFMIAGLMLLLFIIAISSKLLVSIFTTPGFYEAWKYIPILALGSIFSGISAFVGSNFIAAKQSKYFLYSGIWVIAVSLIGNYILIPRFGIMGAALTMPISFSVMVVSRILYAWKYVQIKNMVHYVIMLFLGAAMIFTVLYIQLIVLKLGVIVLLFCLLIGINYQLKNDIIKGISLLKLNKKNLH